MSDPHELDELLHAAAVLRRATGALDVTVAPVDAIRAGGQRRRRQRRLAAGALAAAASLLVVVGVVRLASDHDRPVDVASSQGVSRPQPLLVPAGVGDARLDAIGATGVRSLWWTAPAGWAPVEGVLLGDGRRVGLARSTASGPVRYRLDEVDADGRTRASHPLAIAADGAVVDVDLIGAVGGRAVVSEMATTVSGAADATGADVTLRTTRRVVAVDLDDDQTHVVFTDHASGAASAAEDALAVAPGERCSVELRRLVGANLRAAATADCPSGATSLPGVASGAALSPDGRYLALRWRRLPGFGTGHEHLVVLDRSTGAVVYESPEAAGVQLLTIAWTGDRTLAVLVPSEPSAADLPRGADGPVRVAPVVAQR